MLQGKFQLLHLRESVVWQGIQSICHLSNGHCIIKQTTFVVKSHMICISRLSGHVNPINVWQASHVYHILDIITESYIWILFPTIQHIRNLPQISMSPSRNRAELMFPLPSETSGYLILITSARGWCATITFNYIHFWMIFTLPKNNTATTNYRQEI